LLQWGQFMVLLVSCVVIGMSHFLQFHLGIQYNWEYQISTFYFDCHLCKLQMCFCNSSKSSNSLPHNLQIFSLNLIYPILLAWMDTTIQLSTNNTTHWFKVNPPYFFQCFYKLIIQSMYDVKCNRHRLYTYSCFQLSCIYITQIRINVWIISQRWILSHPFV
jgi:hypothetical protein